MSQSPSPAAKKTDNNPASTPMLKQYHALKANHQHCILFFRLGDFYEMFYEDAKIASRVLDLVLTSRGKGASQQVPMCGVPHHAAQNYIARLIKEGYKVAICDQVEDPATAKGIVKRDVTRIITKGTYLDESDNDTRYILALGPHGKRMGMAFVDPTSGTIYTNQYSADPKHMLELLSTLPVFECVYPEAYESSVLDLFEHPILKSRQIVLSPFDDWCFNPDMTRKSLCEHFGVHNLSGFGIDDIAPAVASCGALLEYLKQMNKQPVKHVDRITLYTNENYCYISPAAHRGLELDTLIRSVDYTQTAPGKRLFRNWYYHPLRLRDQIHERQNAVTLLRDKATTQEELRSLLQKIPDVEKNISRLSCGYIHAKDLLAIRNTLALLPDLKTVVDPLSENNPLFSMTDLPDLREFLCTVVNSEIPLSKPEGHIVMPGYHPELDELRGIQDNGRSWLKDYQEREIKRTGIPSLKIGFNKVFGYYLEVTKTHMKNVPTDYIRKQTLANAERYITPELKEYEEKILTAQDKIIKIENEIVKEIRQRILTESLGLHAFCHSVAVIDCILSLTTLSLAPNYVCPTITETSLLQIKSGRHPVVEKTTVENFIANDTLLDSEDNQLIILTGPNMAGKSTYIRQTAILVIMAQVGSYLPAESATIGLVDKIFTRIGAHDDISKGQSTFMVEMNETADILNNLTDRSLVILDEIGRGTSTYDGLSLAWALAEHLQTTKTRTLFATHFHELTALADKSTGVKNYNVAVKEWKDEIIFMHKIIEGSSDDSYGIYVAKLAGIPANVIVRARQILTQLELNKDLKQDLKTNFQSEDQLTLFSQSAVPDPQLTELRDALDQIDINALTPIEALNQLNALKKIINS